MEFVRSGGVRGEGMDHAKRFPRTLAGFGLTGHGEVDFHVFWKYWKLTPSPNNPNWSSGLQIGPRIFVLSQGTISGAIK